MFFVHKCTNIQHCGDVIWLVVMGLEKSASAQNAKKPNGEKKMCKGKMYPKQQYCKRQEAGLHSKCDFGEYGSYSQLESQKINNNYPSNSDSSLVANKSIRKQHFIFYFRSRRHIVPACPCSDYCCGTPPPHNFNPLLCSCFLSMALIYY